MIQLEEKKRDLIQNTLVQGTQQIFDTLETTTQLKGNLRNGGWSNKNNLFCAYLTYSPNDDPAEESVDVTFDLNIRDRVAQLSVDMSWSNGVIIAEIFEQEVLYDNIENLLSKIDTIMSRLIVELPKEIKQALEKIA